jgi:UDP:flavonoid glycosyltransferase YjiC (YdhE family)
VVDWISYSRTMPLSDVVVCHGGHGTLVRALACGRPVVACPAIGDMNENAARLDWAGAGVRVPRRFASPRAVRLAVERVLGDVAIQVRARELGRWAREHDAGTAAASVLEEFGARSGSIANGAGGALRRSRRRHTSEPSPRPLTPS